MAKLQPWADGPFPLIETPAHKVGKQNPDEFIANDMACVHNAFIRCLNTMYLQAEGVTNEKDIVDFLTYCKAWLKTLHHHHHCEETDFFLVIEKLTGVPGVMGDNVEQHKAFHDGLDAFDQYVHSVKSAEYDGAKIKKLIDSFSEALTQHLHDEIPTLLVQKKYDPEGKWKKEYMAWADRLVAKCDVSFDHPWVLGNNDNTYEGGQWNGLFPPIPWFVYYLVKYWYSRKYAGAWRFCSCDFLGNPRPLQFLPKNS